MGKKIFIGDEHAAKAETLGEVPPSRQVQALPQETDTDELELLARLGEPQTSKESARTTRLSPRSGGIRHSSF